MVCSSDTGNTLFFYLVYSHSTICYWVVERFLRATTAGATAGATAVVAELVVVMEAVDSKSNIIIVILMLAS